MRPHSTLSFLGQPGDQEPLILTQIPVATKDRKRRPVFYPTQSKAKEETTGSWAQLSLEHLLACD